VKERTIQREGVHVKILAYTEPNAQGELITIYEALRRRSDDPENWEGKIYYDIIHSRPLVAVKRGTPDKDSSSFSYQGGSGSGHGRGSKGIVHELAQDFLCRQDTFRFSLFKHSFVAEIEQAVDEVRIVDPKNLARTAYVDVMLHLREGNDIRKKFGDRIAIEITDTHGNTKRKEKLFRDLGISALEVKVPAEWHIENLTTVTSQELETLKRRIAGFWRAEIYVDYIHARARIT